jgi:hypothetical protein
MKKKRTELRRVHAWLIALVWGIGVTVGTVSPASAITGGEEAAEPYSFLGSLQRPDSPRSDSEHVCGVTLIAPTWAVTAAHCARTAAQIYGGPPTSGHPRSWKVRFGSTSLDAGGQLVEVAQFVQYANEYAWMQSVDGELGDIALLRLAAPVDLAPASIAEASPAAGATLRALGWGATFPGTETSPPVYATRLQELDMTSAACDGSRPDEFCAEVHDGRSTQDMDSGGPALTEDAGGWSLAGLIQGGNVAENNFVDITKYREWIDGYVSGRTQIPADSPFPSSALNGTIIFDNACSGALIQAPKSTPDDRVLALTNGHCLENRPAPGETIGPQPLDPGLYSPAVIVDENGNAVMRSPVGRLLAATMTGTDVAVLELAATYREVEAAGISPLTLADSGPLRGDDIQILSGRSKVVWTCLVGAVVPELREAGYSMKNSIDYLVGSGCDDELQGAGHGDSGSPIVKPGTRAIIGLHNTGNDDGQECTENNPCEIDAGGTVNVVQGAKYGQQVSDLNTCFMDQRTFTLSTPGCRLAGTSTPAAHPADAGPATVVSVIVLVSIGTAVLLLLLLSRLKRHRAASR